MQQLAPRFVFLVLLTFLSYGTAANPLVLNANTAGIDLLPVGSRLFIAAQAPSVAPSSPTEFITTLTPASQINRLGGKYWLYAKLRNDTDISQWVFDPHNSIIDRIDAYIYQAGSAEQLRTGHLYPQDFALHYGREIQLLPGREAEVLIYFESRYYSSLPSFEIAPAATFRHKVLAENTWILGCIGAILVLSIYNLFLGVWTKDRNYIYYALYLIFSILGWSATFNLWAQWLDWYSLKLILIPFYPAIAFNILYFIHFLELRKNSPLLTKISYGLVAVCTILACSYPWISPGVYFMLLSMVSAIWIVLGLVVGIYRLRQGYKPAAFFVAAFSVVFIAVNLSILPNLGFKELIPNADLGTLVAQTIDMLLLALALAHRIRVLQDDRELALQSAFDSEQRASIQEKKANNILTEANTKLQQALEIAGDESNKKNNFLRMLSHELRTPLHSISSSAEELDENSNDADKAELIKYISYSAARLRTQVDNLVLLAETDNDELVAGSYIFELQPILDRLSANMETLLEPKAVEFIISSNDLPMGFYGDGYLLEHLLRTNLENACKYTEKGSVRFDLEWLNEEQVLQVKLIDTGRGMSQDQLKRVFEDFSQLSTGLDRQSEGLGLGLTVCSRMCTALDAEFEIDSILHDGTTVNIKIPLKSISDEMEAQSLDADGRGAVLIVEDNPVNAKVLGRIVHNCGYEVDITHSGSEAITAVSKKLYRVILMDIQMPGMDGIATTTEIRKSGITTPIIAVTANSDISVRRQCMERGMNGFLVKPVRTADIKRALEHQLPFAV